MRVTVLAACAAIVVLLTETSVSQVPPPPPVSLAVWVFGDSNVDSGWYKATPSGLADYDALFADASLGVGAPTNNPGPMSVEFLAGLLHTTATPANQGGTNYATSGARNTLVNTTASGGFPNAVPTITQINNYLQQHGLAGDNDIFLVDSGTNDVGFAVNHITMLFRKTRYIMQQARNLADAISILQQHGAKHIIVVNQPEGFKNQQHPTLAEFRQFYNMTLQNRLATNGVLYAWGDANRVRMDIVNDQTYGASVKFHITYVDPQAGQLACPRPDPTLYPHIKSAWAIVCSSSSPVSKPTQFADHTLFADDQHWASTAQAVLGSYFYCLVKAKWPQLAPQPVACNAFSEFHGVP
jgi:phospholipase/lecithinase/hemolysin